MATIDDGLSVLSHPLKPGDSETLLSTRLKCRRALDLHSVELELSNVNLIVFEPNDYYDKGTICEVKYNPNTFPKVGQDVVVTPTIPVSEIMADFMGAAIMTDANKNFVLPKFGESRVFRQTVNDHPIFVYFLEDPAQNLTVQEHQVRPSVNWSFYWLSDNTIVATPKAERSDEEIAFFLSLAFAISICLVGLVIFWLIR